MKLMPVLGLVDYGGILRNGNRRTPPPPPAYYAPPPPPPPAVVYQQMPVPAPVVYGEDWREHEWREHQAWRARQEYERRRGYYGYGY
jgi:hypothetical protein